MALMTGLALSSAPRADGPPEPAPPADPADSLFKDLVVSNPTKARSHLWVQGSFVGHAVAIAALILIPIFWQGPPPEHTDYIRALIYNPPPPPPPPLPKGSAMLEKVEVAKPVTPDP